MPAIPKAYMGGAALLVGALIAVTQVLNLPSYLHYLWALLVFAWGVLTLVQK